MGKVQKNVLRDIYRMNSVTQISKLETINNQIASQEIEAGRKKVLLT